MVLSVVPCALAREATRTLRYRGYALRAPASWPVFDLGRAPETCVRFDRHAVYLGTPGARQNCPAHAAGRTEAILVRPLDASAAGGARGQVTPGAGAIDTFAVPTARLVVTATWSRRRSLVSALVHHRLRATATSTRRAPHARAAATGRRAGRDLPLGGGHLRRQGL